MVSENTDFLKSLCQANAPSGQEQNVLPLIEDRVRPYCDKIQRDKLGNLLCFYHGNGSQEGTLLLCAHADEVGFMITEICADGLLRFSEVGGMDPRILCGKPVSVGFGDLWHNGVICASPLHLQKRKERDLVPQVSDLRIDIGAKDKEDAQKRVRVGDYAVFRSEFVRFGKNYLKAKALDDRLGCAILAEVLCTLGKQNIRPPHDLCFAFTLREEVGLSGANVVAHTVAPNRAIVLETTAIADLPDVEAFRQVAKVGCGGVLSLMDRSTIYHKGMVDFAQRVAKEHSLPLQVKRYVSGGNDSAHIHKSRSGIATLALSAPCRYLHSPACVIDLNDADAMEALVLAMVQEENLPKTTEVFS